MRFRIISVLIFASLILAFNTCSKYDCHQHMMKLLAEVKERVAVADNIFSPAAKLMYIDSLLSNTNSLPDQIAYNKYQKANFLMELGREDDAIQLYEEVLKGLNETQANRVKRDLAIAYMRKGERANCISGHEAESCLMPIRGLGIHRDTTGSSKAIELYLDLLAHNPLDMESRWLLNLAYMTLGQYPDEVPKEYLLPGLNGDTLVNTSPFQDVAPGLGLAISNMAGGSIIDDFDQDGYLDIITSSMNLNESMHFFKNMGDGTFNDITEESMLSDIRGGLNIIQADYDNDGDKDILVLRGGWQGKYGDEPNSLLQNQGDGTFRDVTTISGLLSFHPTQTATWNDFNNDGWLDVFIGNESTMKTFAPNHPCELYINNTDGTFRNIADIAKCNIVDFVKGVTSGDYDNDGWKDIFISTMNGKRLLLKNLGITGKEISFRDVTIEAGLKNQSGNTFPTWFWDYDNDGWLDIFVCDYSFQASLANYAAEEKLNRDADNPDKMLLYRNNRNGTFTNIAKEVGLDKVVFAMGANFGDINNDGFLDMYLGTGNPSYQSLIPNKMFLNLSGERFEDITTSARVGHLQKGHGVSFADMDNDGDQDIFIEMGGSYPGDAYPNAFFLNPGQTDNNWIKIELRGTKSNKDAIGTRVKLSFKENGITRHVYRDVNSGGSFGASPLRREIGIGQATVIDEIEILWHGTNTIQRFKNVQPNQFIKLTEGSDVIEKMPVKLIQWQIKNTLCLPESYSVQ